MDSNAVIAVAVVLISIYLTTQEILKYRLKKEQIKADALVKTEEIKAKNQLEIEKLIHQDNSEKVISISNSEDAINNDENLNSHRSRINDRF
ncbi:hypothetical protein [Ruminiclostridium papyrosolvens]|uniref:Uncharacterized protein n=1 Tax=Ruminiclostridium papyrosolvens C7 TaxID=1330534 RepID=U4R2Q9_9FIRM|nr:hypothetical protein [Ruminiclostridium papyrosolvens]EPR12781.1 hypothetical protein L323_07405 [Ruminiclostridium papyrosolvens C7]